MAIVNGVVTAPVTMDDISSALNYGSSNLGTIINNGNINVNSLKKPCKHPEIGIMSAQQLRSVDWGWGIPYNSLGEILRDIGFNLSAYKWSVLRPSGGDYEPYRMTDMEGYNINASAPFKLRILNDTYKRWDFLSFAIDDIDELTNIADWYTFNDKTTQYKSKPMLALWVTTSPTTHSSSTNYKLYVIGGGYYGLTIEDVLSGGELRISPSNMKQLIDEYTTSMYLSLILIRDGSGLGNGTANRVISVRGTDLQNVVRTAYGATQVNVEGGGSGQDAPAYVKFSIASMVFDENSMYLTSITYYCEISSGGGISKVNVDTYVRTQLGTAEVVHSHTFSSSGYWTVNYNTPIEDGAGGVRAELRATYTDNTVQRFEQGLGNITK